VVRRLKNCVSVEHPIAAARAIKRHLASRSDRTYLAPKKRRQRSNLTRQRPFRERPMPMLLSRRDWVRFETCYAESRTRGLTFTGPVRSFGTKRARVSCGLILTGVFATPQCGDFLPARINKQISAGTAYDDKPIEPNYGNARPKQHFRDRTRFWSRRTRYRSCLQPRSCLVLRGRAQSVVG
jgi:hypothetical protein